MSRGPGTISDKIEPELRLPPPRKVRRRAPGALESEIPSGVSDVAVKIQTFTSVLFLAPTLIGLFFLYRLINFVSEVTSGGGRPNPKSFADGLPLLIVTLVWNAAAIGMAWQGLVKPLVHRWLVMYGRPAVARVTAASPGPKYCTISYLFCPEGGHALTGTAEAYRDDWVDGRKLNAEITVLFFPGHPKWNTPYRHSGYEAVAPDESL